VRWEGFDASHDSWVPRRDITPKALDAYEKFLRSEPPRRNKSHNSGTGISAVQREGFKKKLETFIGVNGQYSVIETLDAYRASTIPTPRGERAATGTRHDGTDDMVTDSDSASGNNLSVAAGGRRSHKPPGFYRE
jgi:hypothetical protein